jgi:hypothetical protein
MEYIKNPKFLPTIMIGLQTLTAMSYAVNDIHNWRMIGYWAAASVLTICVTY